MKDLKILLQEEERYRFSKFSPETAWELGTLARLRAKEESLPVAISIEQAGQLLFQTALPGTSPDNDAWMRGKRNVVRHFRHSSYYMAVISEEGKKTEEDYYLKPGPYRLKGGSFPLLAEDGSLLGTLTISGLKDCEDHDFAVKVLAEYLKNQGVS